MTYRYSGTAWQRKQQIEGWPLQVYKYDIEIPNDLQQRYDGERMFDLFLKYNNIDIREIRLSIEFDNIVPEIAVW